MKKVQKDQAKNIKNSDTRKIQEYSINLNDKEKKILKCQ